VGGDRLVGGGCRHGGSGVRREERGGPFGRRGRGLCGDAAGGVVRVAVLCNCDHGVCACIVQGYVQPFSVAIIVHDNVTDLTMDCSVVLGYPQVRIVTRQCFFVLCVISFLRTWFFRYSDHVRRSENVLNSLCE